jgi:adenine-specific DNA-methyltransferase
MKSQVSLFGDDIIDVPSTEGIKYAGSKLKLLPHILELARRTGAKSVLDGFSGTTRVAQAFAKRGYRVVANDVSRWSEIFGKCYLLNRRERRDYVGLIDHLNSQEPRDGWFTKNYGAEPGEEAGLKRPWQAHNTRKVDAIRDEIDKLSLSEVDRAVALTSLILALDRVDSTLGHFVSYLREWSPRSYNELTLQVPGVFPNTLEHEVLRSDALSLGDVSVDLAYFDPPYGSNNEKMPPSRVRYASYYHVWTTIILNDRPNLFGKAQRRADSSDTVASSIFEEFRRDSRTGRFIAVDAIERLLSGTHARFIILSYSSGGRATAADLAAAIHSSGSVVEILEIKHKRNVMAEMKWTNDWIRDAEMPNREFLFLIEKRKMRPIVCDRADNCSGSELGKPSHDRGLQHFAEQVVPNSPPRPGRLF